MNRVYVAGTFDTKGEELCYVASLIAAAGLSVRTVDLSTSGAAMDADVPARQVAAHHPGGTAAVLVNDRGAAVTAMATAFTRFTKAHTNDIAALLGLGGSGGTAIVAPAMQTLPTGLPKLMVSTVASGNVAGYVGPSDIAMLYSVTDLAGLNRVSRRVLGNAAHAVTGMVAAHIEPDLATQPAIGLTMFGVTTPCVTYLRDALRDTYECLVFHATGTGGRSMERLADDGVLAGVLDMTTTEVCDLLLGGTMSAGEQRLDAIARARLPYVGSCGALDMVNFGPPASVPYHYQDRTLYAHNPQATLMRTTAAESKRVGAWIAAKLNACTGPVRFVIPGGGVSALDAPRQPFHDPGADQALFDTLERDIRPTPDRRLIRLPYHINAPGFAQAVAEIFRTIA